jgi:hypothetical protein
VRLHKRISRRAFLALCGASAAAVSAGAVKLIGGKGPPPREKLTSRVAAVFTDIESANAVGEAYLDTRPSEDDERRLVRLLRESNSAWPQLSRPADIRRLARAHARRDYAAGRLAVVDGWYLSQTEARLCALTTFA